MDKRFLTLSEAAVLMGKSVQTLRRLIKKGELQGQRIKTPQGFHYVVNREEMEALGYIAQKEIFSESPIQKPEEALVEEEKEVLTSQKEMLIKQHVEPPHEDADYYVIDRQVPKNVVESEIEQKTLYAIIEGYHQEKIALIRILEKLQERLEKDQAKPKSLLRRWLG